jgi:hypothetical protein
MAPLYTTCVGEDGITRFYDPSKHSWRTEKELQDEEAASQILDVVTITAAVVLVGGGILWMVIVTFSG